MLPAPFSGWWFCASHQNKGAQSFARNGRCALRRRAAECRTCEKVSHEWKKIREGMRVKPTSRPEMSRQASAREDWWSSNGQTSPGQSPGPLEAD